MNERPILFSGPMVRAILDGRKTMTRRVAKQDTFNRFPTMEDVEYPPKKRNPYDCPHGLPGDRLWVRESMKFDPDQGWRYVADGADVEADYCKSNQHCPSIHMPRWASRITLEITGVKVERIQDISEEDAVAEGCDDKGHQNARQRFETLWNGINSSRGFGWNVNPWVWAITFRRVS